MDDPASGNNPARGNAGRPSRRRSARVAAVQALYQMDVTGTSAPTVVEEFLRDRLVSDEARGTARAAASLADDGEIDVFPNADRTLFADIVRGAAEEMDVHDRMIAGALDHRWSIDRLEAVLRAILRAAVFELRRASADTPARVIINEYVDVAHAFYGGKEPGLVNGVLDRLAKVLNDDAPADAGPA